MFKLLLIAAIVATASAGCRERHITNTFTYFNSGSATGCEHRYHYLYEYAGADCIWTSPPTALRDLGKYDYEWMRVEFKVADYGKMEYSDYVKVEMAPCLNGKCERFYQTELIRDDTKMKGLDGTWHARYYGKNHDVSGWYWQTVYQAKGSHANWMYQLDKHHNQVKMRITLRNSGHTHREYHILDNLEVKGWACDKPVKTAYPTGYPTAFPTGFPTAFPTGFPTSFPTSYPTPQCSVTCSWVKKHHIQVTHDRTLIAHNKKYNGAHYDQHKCWHDGTSCHCECHGTNWKGHGNTKDKTSLANCKNTKIAGTFSKFNTGTAKGCEHRTHYLYEYRGTDCVWTSNYNRFKHPHNFDGAMVKFQMAEYGSLESDDYVLIELRFCGKGKNYGKARGWGNYDCTVWKPTVKLANDVLGWVWTTVTGANRDAFFTARFGRYRVTSRNWRNYKLSMEPHQQWVQIKITLRSSDNYREQHILDNMEVWGGCQ